MVQFEQDKSLSKTKHVKHGFFGRLGKGENNDFNCSYVISKDQQQVKLNRRLAANIIGGDKVKIAALSQIHSNKIIAIDNFSDLKTYPKADALVTKTKGIALAILTADCAPILFADRAQNIIGAAHAGWQGALTGIVENTILAMEKLGAKRENIIAAIGPTISGNNYEVGRQRAKQLIKINQHAQDFIFIPKGKVREHFDLPKFIIREAQKSNIAQIGNLDICTYQNPNEYFSHRFATHHNSQEGRQISIISIN